MSESTTIEDLVKQAKAGDRHAFAGLYDQFADRIFRFILIKVRHEQEAEDLLQTVFIKAWNGLGGFDLRKANFSAWLYKIATNAVYDYFRKSARQPQNLELNEDLNITIAEDTGSQMDQIQAIGELRKKLKLLPSQYREVLELRFVQDFTLKETAEILQKSSLSVRLLQHRALKKLKGLV